jgi:hypothetical protein
MRRRRLTLVPSALEGRSSPDGSRFSPLSEEDSESGSCSSEVPFEAALQVLDDPKMMGSLTAAMIAEGGSGEELAGAFWADIGYPNPASRFWEKTPTDWHYSDEGTCGFDVFGCRDSSEDHRRHQEEPTPGGTSRTSLSPVRRIEFQLRRGVPCLRRRRA